MSLNNLISLKAVSYEPNDRPFNVTDNIKLISSYDGLITEESCTRINILVLLIASLNDSRV
jgi:hypothetical protein